MEKEKIICENSADRCSMFRQHCWKEEAEYEVTIYYNKLGTDKDTLLLCGNCMQSIVRDAKKSGYSVAISKLNSASKI